MSLVLALKKLSIDFNFEELLFWGKITGVAKDYYVAMALNYIGELEFPSKKFFWCTSDNWTFASLPEPMYTLREIFVKSSVFFSGEFDNVIIEAPTSLESGSKSDIINMKEYSHLLMEIPPRGVTELDRLAFVVNEIEYTCQAVPKNSFKMTPMREVRRNEAFVGRNDEEIFTIGNYEHFRAVSTKEKKEQLDRDEGIYNPDFLDDICSDYPACSWSVLKDTMGEVAIIRNRLWQGYYGYHKLNTGIFGGIYVGDGVCNQDLPFLI